MVLEANGEELVRAASLADECGQEVSAVRVNGEGGGRPGLLRAGGGHDGVRLRPNGRSRPCRVPSRADGRRGPRGSESADERRRERRRRRARPGPVVVRRPLRRTGGLAVSAKAEVGVCGKRTRERRIRR